MTMIRRRPRLAAAALAAIALGGGMIGSASAGQSDLQKAKAATAQFHDLTVAGDANFGPFPVGVPLHSCIASLDGSGAMGFHWLNPDNLNLNLDPTTPQVLVYAPDKHGRLKLAALEYVIFQGAWFEHHALDSKPSMFGEDFMPNDGSRFQLPPFFALHVWLFQDNPAGMFMPFNPNVSCDSGTAAGRSGSRLAATTLTADAARRFACAVPNRSA